MYVRVTATPNSPRKSVKVVESIREGLKVKQVMIHHVGVASTEDEIVKLKQLGSVFIAQEQLRREHTSAQLGLFDQDTLEQRLAAVEQHGAVLSKKRGRKPALKLQAVAADAQLSLADLVEEQRVIEGMHDIAGFVYDQIGYNTILKRKKDQDLLKDLVLMRIAEPSSKLRAQQLLSQRFAKLHDLDAIYRLMDKLFPRLSEIKMKTFQKTKELMPQAVDILFFDCTTLYFESVETDELREFGYSKDHRFNTTQVVLALATNKDGLPLGYELFEGNKAEVKTLLESLAIWKTIFNIENVCFVADRAMMSDANLKQLEEEGHHYVIAAKLRCLPTSLINEIFLKKSQEAAHEQTKGSDWIHELAYKERRLIVSYKTERARRDAKQREQVVKKIKTKIGEKGNTEKLISNQGVKKYTTTNDAKTSLEPVKIEADQAWDGLHGVISNIPDQTPTSLLERYSGLWKIEESFRINKHTLSMRPIYHFKAERIKAHIGLCYMAFSVLRYLEYTVGLTQKIGLMTLLDELMQVQASYYRHVPSGRCYRMPGKFSQNASKIYKAFQVERRNHAQVFA